MVILSIKVLTIFHNIVITQFPLNRNKRYIRSGNISEKMGANSFICLILKLSNPQPLKSTNQVNLSISFPIIFIAVSMAYTKYFLIFISEEYFGRRFLVRIYIHGCSYLSFGMNNIDYMNIYILLDLLSNLIHHEFLICALLYSRISIFVFD